MCIVDLAERHGGDRKSRSDYKMLAADPAVAVILASGCVHVEREIRLQIALTPGAGDWHFVVKWVLASVAVRIMTVHQTVYEDGGLGPALEIRRVGLDDFSNVRYLHATSLRAQSSSRLSDDEVAAFVRYVYTPHYVDDLMRTELFAGFLDGTMVGTAAWSAGDDSGEVARLSSVFVNPLFANTGIGRRLVADAEARAISSGFRRITLRATANAVGFFQRLGYEITSYGVSAEAGPSAMVPVTFMRKTMPSLG